MNNCAIFGAGGHGRVVAEIAELNGYTTIEFYDDGYKHDYKNGTWNVIGNFESLKEKIHSYNIVAIAIGNNQIRIEKQNILIALGGNLQPLIHPKAVISKYAKIGKGSVIMANAVVNPYAIIKEGCIINTGAIIEHDCNIENGVHISPNATLCGNVNVGYCTWIGAGSSIKQGITIANKSIIGAGSVITKQISESGVIVGNPATYISKL